MASEYFSEISRGTEDELAEIASELVTPYLSLSKLIERAAQKDLPDEEKVQTIWEARDIEENCVDRIEDLLGAF
jgi:hypothetical protein